MPDIDNPYCLRALVDVVEETVELDDELLDGRRRILRHKVSEAREQAELPQGAADLLAVALRREAVFTQDCIQRRVDFGAGIRSDSHPHREWAAIFRSMSASTSSRS